MIINSLDDAIKTLSRDDLSTLTYAFDNGFSHTVFLNDGYFVAVHSSVPAIEANGAWKFGQTPKDTQ